MPQAFLFPPRSTGSTSSDIATFACTLALVVVFVGCVPSMDRYRWDMDAQAGSVPMMELRARRLVIRGMTAAQVKRVWGNPQEKVEMPPSYLSLTWKTREGWVTVVFEHGRVQRVEALIPEALPGASLDTSRTPSESR